MKTTSLFFERFTGTRVPILDLLRCVAITFVVLDHYDGYTFPGGGIGVSIFFCLSGYLITTNLLEKNVTIGEFLVRRIFRIYPAYVVVCLLHVGLLYILDHPLRTQFVEALPGLLLFIKMPNKWIGFGVGVFWTLQIELWFYIFIPFVIKLNNHVLRFRIVIGLILISLVFKSLVYFKFGQLSSYSIVKTVYWMDNLLYGVLAALLLNYLSPLYRIKKTVRSSWRIINILIGLSLSLMVLYWPNARDIWPWQSTLASALSAVIIFSAIRYRLYEKLTFVVITYGSLFAYAIYLLHPFPLDYYGMIKTLLGVPTMTYKVIVLTTMILSTICLHYFIEKPGMVIGKKLNKVINRHD
jgi:peptidoglycan/LPS O-acetylase OafA/YrhL